MQTWALLVDSYRLLMQRKLFWFTLAISAIVVLAYGSIGFNDKGVTLLFGLMEIESKELRAGTGMGRAFYKTVFSILIMGGWLTWIATILALISTSTIFTDLMSAGSVDLVLAKPISRVRIFFVKYIGSLLFVLLQVALFCIGVFLCIGFRIGEWNWKIFIAIPLVLVFFSYLYSVNVLIAMTTRSTIAALLITMLFWAMLFTVQFAELQLKQVQIQLTIAGDAALKHGARLDANIHQAKMRKDPAAAIEWLTEQRDEEMSRADEAHGNAAKIEAYHLGSSWLLAVLPKTKQTLDLMDRWVVNKGENSITDVLLYVFNPGNSRRGRRNEFRDETIKAAEAEYESRSPWYIIGTSLAFEAVLLCISCWIFVRRDF